MHIVCGKTNGEEGYWTSVLCILCSNEKEIQIESTDTTNSIEKKGRTNDCQYSLWF